MGVKIDYSNLTNADDAFKKAKSVITPSYIEKFNVKADITYDEAKRTVKAKGSGFKLDLCFFDNYCDLNVDLSFLLKPLKGKIVEMLEAQIKKNI